MSYQSLDHISNDDDSRAFKWSNPTPNPNRFRKEETILKPGDEVVCEYTFNGVNPEDLPFKSREVLIIRGPTKDTKWYRAEHPRGESGLIPINYVRKREDVLHPVAPWFHGKITRQDAERLLAGTPDGSYLVRESVKYPGDFTLSVVFNEEMSHYRIKYHELRFTVDDEDYFLSLHQLIDHYSRAEDGLVCRLAEPVVFPTNFALSTLQQHGKLIRKEELTFGALIGKGEFGEVYQGKFRGTKDVALKCLIRDSSRPGGDDEVFTYEAAVMTSLSHRNLVAFIGLVNESDRMVLITEFMSKGSLINYLRSRGRAVISKEDQIRFSVDTCQGMAYLEEKGLVHRDLAARNVLLDNNLTAKVADFGLARKVEDLPLSPDPSGGHPPEMNMGNVPATNQNRIPIKWTAPEAVRNNLFTNKSDVWSFGILLWEIYSFGRMPYPRIMAAHVVRHIEAGYRMEMPEECPLHIYNIMRDCWQSDPNKRPSFSSICNLLRNGRQNATGPPPPPQSQQNRPMPPTPQVPYL